MSELDKQIETMNALAEKIGSCAKQIEKSASFTMADMVEMVRERICDAYCRYPLVYSDDDERLQLECDRCPMRLLG